MAESGLDLFERLLWKLAAICAALLLSARLGRIATAIEQTPHCTCAAEVTSD